MTTEIPKRPEMDPDDYEGETAFLDGLIDHEHAVARVAVEALKDLVLAVRIHGGDCRSEFNDACDALTAIEASGWQP